MQTRADHHEVLGQSRMPDHPVVSLIVAMKDEADHIATCLQSILAQDYPQERLEILVYDGGSADGSRAIAELLLSQRPMAAVRDNPRRIQAAAWNLGIDAASGDVMGIVSGHAALAHDYVRNAVATLRRTGADMVGGPVRAIGDGPTAEAVAVAMSTPFGVGGATFRYLDHEAEVDTVFMGICPRDVYRAFRFDEEMVRNQDDELSYRLLDAGARIVCSPAIRSSYRSRGTVQGLWRQYFDYGYWKVRVLEKHPDQARIRHVVPAAFVGVILVGAPASVTWRPAAVASSIIVASYVAADLLASARARRGLTSSTLARLPFVYPVLHLAYGAGFIAGLTTGHRWTSPRIRAAAIAVVARTVRHLLASARGFARAPSTVGRRST